MILSNTQISCDKCNCGVSYPLVKSHSRLISVAVKEDNWLVKNGKHYCDKCKSEVNNET